jgi:hypothetical protein
LAVGASLTLALGAVLFFLVVFVAPVALLQAIAGLRVYAGRLRWLWIAVPCALVGLWLGLAMTAGIAAPIAWATVAVNTAGIATALLARVVD